MREALIAFYEVHNPSQLVDVLLDEIVAKYLGQESQLLARLHRRYGEMPRVPYLPRNGGKLCMGCDDTLPYKSMDDSALNHGSSIGIHSEAEKASDEARANLLSPHFDATFTLTQLPRMRSSVKAVIPVPDAPLFDNLSRSRHLLSPSHTDYMPPWGPKEEAARAARRQALVAKKTAIAAARGPPLLQMLAESLKTGPTGLLYRCYQEKKAVVVTVRRRSGLRGTVTGRLRGFDRHFNLVLEEAQEALFVRREEGKDRGTGEGEGAEGEQKERRRSQRKRGRRAGRKHKLPGKRKEAQREQEDDSLVGTEEGQDQPAVNGGRTEEWEEDPEGGRKRKRAEARGGVEERQAGGEEASLAKHQKTGVRQDQGGKDGGGEGVLRRTFPLVVVRGDNVVMVFEAAPARSTHAR